MSNSNKKNDGRRFVCANSITMRVLYLVHINFPQRPAHFSRVVPDERCRPCAGREKGKMKYEM